MDLTPRKLSKITRSTAGFIVRDLQIIELKRKDLIRKPLIKGHIRSYDDLVDTYKWFQTYWNIDGTHDIYADWSLLTTPLVPQNNQLSWLNQTV